MKIWQRHKNYSKYAVIGAAFLRRAFYPKKNDEKENIHSRQSEWRK
jgi:hypothetical protein